MGKLIKRILGSRLLIQSLPELALRMHDESPGRAPQFNMYSQSLLADKLFD